MVKDKLNISYQCPLINDKICDGLCYDIQMVRGLKTHNEEMLKEFLMIESADIEMMKRANELCPNCPFNLR